MTSYFLNCFFRSRFLVIVTIFQMAAEYPLQAMEGVDDPFNDPYLGTFKGFESDRVVSPSLLGSVVSYSVNVGTTIYSYMPGLPNVKELTGVSNFSSWLGYYPVSPPNMLNGAPNQTIKVHNHEFVVLSDPEKSSNQIKMEAQTPVPHMTAFQGNLIILK